MLYKTLLVGITQNGFQRLAISLDAIGLVVFTHELAGIFKLLGHPRQSDL